MLIIVKTLASLFALLVIARSITDFKNKKESLQMTVFWIIVWLAIVAIAAFPELINIAISALGGNRTGLGTIFGMAIIFVLFICYRIYVKANRIEKNLNSLIKENALRNLKEKDNE